MANYGINITLICNLIEADDQQELEQIVNAYIDSLANIPDQSITWESVRYDIVDFDYGEEN